MKLAALILNIAFAGCLISPAPTAPIPLLSEMYSIEATTSFTDAVVEVTVLQKDGRGTGSAVIFERQGNTYYAVTCNHVAEGVGTILLAGDSVCEVVALAPAMDLAVITFTSKTNYPAVGFATPHVDELVRIVGYRTDKHIRRGSITHFLPFGRMSVAGGVYPGYSGGAIFNKKGEIVGITSAVQIMDFKLESDLGIAIRGDVAGKFAQNATHPNQR